MKNPTNPQNSKFLEDLQKASQEIETDLRKKRSTASPQPDYNPPEVPSRRAVGGSESTPSQERAPEVKVENEILAQDWLKEITNERQKLEQAYKEAENLRRKIQQRLDRMKNLEINFSKVKNELTHFQQIKKENQAFLEEIKNMLKNQNEH